MLNVKVDPEFRALIPPLSAEEYAQLEQNIVALRRCREAIVLWHSTIVDGHNRYAICRQHGIAFEVVRMGFRNREEAVLWIIENQLGRRNLTDAARIELAARLTALTRGRAGGLSERQEIALRAKVSETTVHKYTQVKRLGGAELVEKVRRGEVKIGTAYGQLCEPVEVIVTERETLLTDEDMKKACGKQMLMRGWKASLALCREAPSGAAAERDKLRRLLRGFMRRGEG